MKMNILITAPSLNPSRNVSGVSTVVQTIIEYNKEHLYYHYLLGSPDKKISKIVWVSQLIKQLVYFPFAIRKKNIELVHQNLPFNPKGLIREYLINLWCRILSVPVVVHVHGGVFLMDGTSNYFYKFLSKSLFKYAKQVIVLSDLEKDALNNNYQYSTSTVLCNSIDTNIYKSVSRHLISSKPVLLFLGRINNSKGIEDIIESFVLLKKQKTFRFLLCGAGPNQEELITACEKLLGKDFEYRGVVSGDAKINIIKESDFFLLPSRYGEGLPMALLETMAAGVVPVVTDDASMKFVVQNEVNGIRVNKKDPKDLFEKLNSILSNPLLYEILSIKASRTIQKQYGISNYVIKLNKIYNSAIKK
nr:glycosyltransferase family 4 protein [uncultured Flavobacterium sp.]